MNNIRSIPRQCIIRTTVCLPLALLILFCASFVSAADAPFTRLVTTPTAASLPSLNYSLETHLFDSGGVVQTVVFGLHDLIDIGVSYGGSDFIGSSRISLQPHAAAKIQVRILEETYANPAIAVGFDSQGQGAYSGGDNAERFRVKSRGAYIVASRNYRLLGDLGLHGGVNYSLEKDDGDGDPDFWAGLNKSVWGGIELSCEYDAATNDSKGGDIKLDQGYLNAAFKWSFNGVFTIEFDLTNILRTSRYVSPDMREDNPQPGREIRLVYRGVF